MWMEMPSINKSYKLGISNFSEYVFIINFRCLYGVKGRNSRRVGKSRYRRR